MLPMQALLLAASEETRLYLIQMVKGLLFFILLMTLIGLAAYFTRKLFGVGGRFSHGFSRRDEKHYFSANEIAEMLTDPNLSKKLARRNRKKR